MSYEYQNFSRRCSRSVKTAFTVNVILINQLQLQFLIARYLSGITGQSISLQTRITLKTLGH